MGVAQALEKYVEMTFPTGSINFMVHKRRFSMAERTFGKAFCKHFSYSKLLDVG